MEKRDSILNRLNCGIVTIIIYLPFVFHWLGIHNVFSSPLSIAIILIILTFMFLCNFNAVLNKVDVVAILLLVSMLFLNGLTYRSWGVIFTCCNITILSILFNNIQFKKKQLRNIHLLIVILLGIFLLTLKIEPLYKTYTVHTYRDIEININTFGFLVLAIYFHFLLFLEKTSSGKGVKCFLFIVATILAIYYIDMSSCRSALLAMGLFFVFTFFKNWVMERYKRWLLIFIIIAIIFPFFYLGYIEIFEDAVFAGKSMASRGVVWKSAWMAIKLFPITGSGTIFAMLSNSGQYTDSAHNVFWGLWKTVGIISMLIFAYYLYQGRNIRNVTYNNRTAKKMFLSCMSVCVFETLLNDSNLFIFYMTLLLTEKEEAEENQ